MRSFRNIIGKLIYNRKGWILCTCNKCGRGNYVEPHGTTAKCQCSEEETEHTNIPYSRRDVGGMYVRR